MGSDLRDDEVSRVLQMGDLRPREHVHLGAELGITPRPPSSHCFSTVLFQNLLEHFFQNPLLGFAQKQGLNKDSSSVFHSCQ